MSAARKRQTFGLGEQLASLRPWRDESAVAGVLSDWCRGRKGCERLADGHYREVAAHLRHIGQSLDTITNDQLDGAAFFMLRNLIAGREATDYGDGFEYVVNAPSPRSRRRWVASTPERNSAARKLGEPERQSVFWWMRESLQQDLDVAALVRAGRTPSAARRWLERHPGQHAKDAPAPRKRRAA